MKTKLLGLILVIAMLSMFIIPATYAWNYGNPAKPADNNEEWFGPRADRLLITLYSTETNEWDYGLSLGEIDVTDWPLDDTHYVEYTTPPYNNSISVVSFGPEFGLRLLDLNVGNNTYIDSPGYQYTYTPGGPGVTKAPTDIYLWSGGTWGSGVAYGNPMAELALREAVGYLTDRADIVEHVGATTNIAVYSLVGANVLGESPWGKYTDWAVTPTGADASLYPWAVTYNPAAANATLTASGEFPYISPGVRGYTPDPGVTPPIPFTLIEYSREDDPARDYAGALVYAALESVGIQVTLKETDIAGAHTYVMGDKDFSIYTGSWSLDVVPDYLILWDFLFYWNPGLCYDYSAINDPIVNAAAEGAYAANTQAAAVTASIAFQEEMAKMEWDVPMWIAAGYMANYRTYTGGNNGVPVTPDDGENVYRGLYWTGFINEAGFGTDNYFTFLDLHPEGYDWGNGYMTIRCGFKTSTLQELNPIYAESIWDRAVIGLVDGDSLVTRDPLNLATFAPWMCSNFTVGTYANPSLGTCTKVLYTLRNDVFWQDDVPLTIADLHYTFVELPKDLAARGLAAPWWISSVMDVLDFEILDPQNFEILYDAKAIYAIGWAGGNIILPEHIWKPICTTLDPTVTMPDSDLIGDGAWRLVSYVAYSSVLLVANTPQSVVTCLPTTSALGGPYQVGDYAASPINSTEGYFRLLPVSTDLEVAGPPTPLTANATTYLASTPYGGYYPGIRKLAPPDYPTEYTLVDTITNWFADRPINVTSYVAVNGTLLGGGQTLSVANGVGGFPSGYPYSVAGVGFKGAFEEIGPAAGDWFYDGSALFNEKRLYLEPLGFGNHGNTFMNDIITYGPGNKVIGTLAPGLSEIVDWLNVITFSGSPAMSPHIPEDVVFHSNWDWLLPTLYPDNAGQTLAGGLMNGYQQLEEFPPTTGVTETKTTTPQSLLLNPNAPFVEKITKQLGKNSVWSQLLKGILQIVPAIKVNVITLYFSYASELPTPDGKDDGRDITIAAKAFGTKPGDPRWSTVADVNHDYKIDGRDITLIAKDFGWPPYARSGYWIH